MQPDPYEDDPTQPGRPSWEQDTYPAPPGPLTRPSQPVYFDEDPYQPPQEEVLPPSQPPSPPSKKRRRQRRSFGGCLKTWLAIAGMVLVIILGTGFIIGLVVYQSLKGELEEDMVRLQSLEGVEDFESSYIYDRDGNLLYEVFGEGRRTEVPLDDIPFSMRWAIIAVEDDSFYDNPGFDPKSISRAALQWYKEKEIVSGASTITQQLIKQIVFEVDERTEVTLRRKLKEAALAWVMTQQFSKDEILELYLNEVYFGNLAYGVEGAADVYFDKHATELTFAEASFLAGLVQSPAGWDPYTNFDTAKARQRQVLDLMVQHGYLTEADANTHYAASPTSVSDLASPDVSLLAPHFTVEVRRQLAQLPVENLDALLQKGGLEIHTTLDMNYQDLAEELARQQVNELRDEYNLHNAALVAINPNNGEVLAMLGSIDYNDESIDGNVNVILSPQQPGSTMKPFTYALALEQGWSAADIVWDVPMAYDTGIGQGYDYEPVNYDGRFHGPVRLRDALANSYNIPAVTLLREVGVGNLLAFTKRLGIESLGEDPAQYGLSLTLGGGELTPIEMTSAFAAFANGGKKVMPYVITKIVDSDGNVVYDAAADPNVGVGEEVLDPRIAFIISNILSDNDARTPAMGSESPLLLDFPAGAKTGTTNDFRDNWTIGFTPHLVVGVWAGNTDNSPMAEGTSGLTGAAPLWHEYMTAIYNDPAMTSQLEMAGLPPLRSDFAPPEGVEERVVCVISTLRDPLPVADGCPRTRTEWFRVGGLDTEAPATPTIEPTPTATPILDEAGNALPPASLQLEKGLWMMAVLPLNEEQQTAYNESMTQILEAMPEGVPRPSTPKYCEVLPEQVGMPGVSLQIFLAAPPDPVDAIRARNWALTNERPIVPGVPCTEDMLASAGAAVGFDPDTGATYEITSPKTNEEVYGIWPIMGTASFDPARFRFYKIEIILVDGAPNDWVTIGDTHSESVSNGVLEYLHADALPPGTYNIRLVLVQTDGNFLNPFVVPIQIVPEPPTSTPRG